MLSAAPDQDTVLLELATSRVREEITTFMILLKILSVRLRVIVSIFFFKFTSLLNINKTIVRYSTDFSKKAKFLNCVTLSE